MKSTQKYTTKSGTIYRVFEIHEKMEYNESGEKPIFKVPDAIVDKKERKRLN